VCPSTEPANQSGGVNISGAVGSVSGDGSGGMDEERLVVILEARAYLQTGDLAGLQRRIAIYPNIYPK
jgi:hypothetical protein